MEVREMGLPDAVAEQFLKNQVEKKVNGLKSIISTIKLQQITSAIKQKALMDMFEETGEQQVVVFTQFVKTLADLNADLKKDKISFTTLEEGKLKDFQAGKHKVFTSNLIAGGTGLNMQSASTMFFVDFDWNPSINEQAVARIDRIGQNNSMDIYYMVCKDTVDEILWDTNIKKAKMVKKVEQKVME